MKLKQSEWYHRSTLYHIYPLSFADANHDGYGDLRGIIEHLDYLNDGTAESLGVGAIWLSPIYVSPMADWGYDVADHCAIDPRFGTMADFDELLKQAHGRGIRVLLDYVPNHTSDEHRWFKQSRSSRQSAKRDWYIWADPGPDGGPPNNWLSHFGGPAWSLDPKTGQYYLHSFLANQPDLNWRNAEVRKAMLDVLRFWLKKGVDGFRTDAIYGLIKDEQLRDDPPNPNYRAGVSDPADKFLRLYSSGQSELTEVIGTFCEVLAEGSEEAFLLTEVDLNVPALHQLYRACLDHPLHAPFNFNLMSLSWGAAPFRNFIDEYEASLGPDDWPNYVLGNHDRHRLVTRVGPERARLLALLQLTLRGLPVIYYGEELGMPDTVVGPRQIRDQWERNVPGYGLGRDPERGPMAWTHGERVGFSAVRPWLPVVLGGGNLSVEAQERRPESSLHLYRYLIHLRTACPALTTGSYRSLKIANPYVYGYLREAQQQRFMVLLNFDNRKARVQVPGEVGVCMAGTHDVQGDGLPPKNGEVILRPYEGRVYEYRIGGQN